jgi:putative phosphoribosyl transferase
LNIFFNLFKDRVQAAQLLIKKITQEELLVRPDKTVILGIVRGGVVLAQVIAKHFACQLDIIIVKKLSAPADKELAIGAIGETKGSYFIQDYMIKDLAISEKYLAKEISSKLDYIKKQERTFRKGKNAIPLANKDVFIVDDGTATGATMIAAIREVWNNNPHRVIVALPIAPVDTLKLLEREADSVVVLDTPSPFFAIGQFYQNFSQISDKQVINLLKKNSVLS